MSEEVVKIEPVAIRRRYTYDLLDQLVAYDDGGTTVELRFDPAGNRVAVEVAIEPPPAADD